MGKCANARAPDLVEKRGEEVAGVDIGVEVINLHLKLHQF